MLESLRSRLGTPGESWTDAKPDDPPPFLRRIDELNRLNRTERSLERERELLQLRHSAGAAQVLENRPRFLHRTGSAPEMPNPRYAIESWFVGASGFPRDYVPLAF